MTKKLSGILNINKPPDITSHDVVAHIRHILQTKDYRLKTIKVGHTGTLDPFATGILLLAIGSATRLIEYSHGWNKEYETIITLGATSDTDDITGIITKSKNTKSKQLTKSTTQQTLKKFVGTIKQVPPIYSAIKIKGERSYKLARQGSDHSLPTKEVTIHDLKLISYKYPHLSLHITCSTGTYIRSLARDIGRSLGTGAYVKQLNRSRIGPYKITNSIKLNDLTPKNIIKHLLPAKTLINYLPTIILPDDNVAQFYKGQKIENRGLTKQLEKHQPLKPLVSSTQNNLVSVYNSSSALLGIGFYDPTTHLLHPKKVLPSPSYKPNLKQ